MLMHPYYFDPHALVPLLYDKTGVCRDICTLFFPISALNIDCGLRVFIEYPQPMF